MAVCHLLPHSILDTGNNRVLKYDSNSVQKKQTNKQCSTSLITSFTYESGLSRAISTAGLKEEESNKQTNKKLRCGNRKGLLGRNDQTHQAHITSMPRIEEVPVSGRIAATTSVLKASRPKQ